MKRISKIILIPVGILLLQSCFVAKNYKRPTIHTDSLYRMETSSGDSSSMADVPWQQVFTDTTLQRYIEEAIHNNFDIRIAIQHIDAAKAYLKQGRAGQMPTLNAQGGYTLLHPSKYGQYAASGEDPLQQFNLSANLSWEADIWGKIRSQEKAVRAAYLQSIAAHKAVQTQLIASVASI